MNDGLQTNELFDPVLNYPDSDAAERLSNLVGLDKHKERLITDLTLLIMPKRLREWADKFHDGASSIVNSILARPPFVILAGDVGCGKSALAESIADPISRELNVNVMLYPMSLSTRGRGAVGQMTQLLSAAFDHIYSQAKKLSHVHGESSSGAVILLIDEADALAQSRETDQMHHEDRAGVNALIRGIDRLASARLPAAVIMCTNRPNALDPAVERRAADILYFIRPDAEQRKAVLDAPLRELGFCDKAIEAIVSATGCSTDNDGTRREGFTFSDLTQRLLPAIVLSAYPSHAVDVEQSLEIARAMQPTRQFRGESY